MHTRNSVAWSTSKKRNFIWFGPWRLKCLRTLKWIDCFTIYHWNEGRNVFLFSFFSFFSLSFFILKNTDLVVCFYVNISSELKPPDTHLGKPPTCPDWFAGSVSLSSVPSNRCLISTWAMPASEEGCELSKHMLHFYLFMSHYLKVLSPDCHT